jgi:cobalt transporter subunit CbtB
VYSFRIFDGKEGKGDGLYFKSIPCLYLRRQGIFFGKGGDTLERIARLRSIVAVDYRKVLLVLTSVLVAAGIVYIVGFAPYPAIHDAFHDIRHGLGFPCH